MADGRKREGKDDRSGWSSVDDGERFVSLRARLHGQVIDKLDLRSLESTDPKVLREKLSPAVANLVGQDAEGQRLQTEQRRTLVNAILDEIVGLGPLEALLADPSITDIMVNAHNAVYVERDGRIELTDVVFHDNQHLLNTIQRIVSRVGRRLDESVPMVDARLPDGSRVNAIIPPVAPDGPVLSIRRFGTTGLTLEELAAGGALSPEMLEYLAAAVRSKCNLVISGGTGAGKTTLLNALSALIPGGERVVTIEDSAELALQRRHVVRLESRPQNIEGRGEITIRSLVRNALRMRPDRIIVGEVRGAEVLDMLQAMNTGHEGSMTTIHANSPADATGRLMMMLALSGASLSSESMAQFIGRSVRVIVQATRLPGGSRRITEIGEVTGFEGERVAVQPVFALKPARDPHAPPVFRYHGNSSLLARFAAAGIRVAALEGPP
ncbi:MAG: CpaF family protein [Deltaproteobacteria bacterium]|nr:CpaF family protein [Deltaproteobacteria bacterium]